MLKFNNKVILSPNGKWIESINYNPLNLPSYTIRLLYKDDVVPIFDRGTGVQVSESPNIWDLTYKDNNWALLLEQQVELLEVLGANTTNVTRMDGMFENCYSLTSVHLFDTSSVTRMDNMFDNCYSLTSVPLFDTSNVTDMSYMFQECNLLTSVPLFDTSNVTDMSFMFDACFELINIPLFNTANVTNVVYMFNLCYKVESGALAIYNQMSTQTTPPERHTDTFRYCGALTQTGAAELAQIPASWGGTL